jgi:hypothetical protein
MLVTAMKSLLGDGRRPRDPRRTRRARTVRPMNWFRRYLKMRYESEMDIKMGRCPCCQIPLGPSYAGMKHMSWCSR